MCRTYGYDTFLLGYLNRQGVGACQHMPKSFESFSLQGSEIIDLQYLQNRTKKQPKGASRSSSQNYMAAHSQLNSRSTSKIASQQAFNNNYLTLPSLSQDLPLMGTDALKTMVNQVQKGLATSLPLAYHPTLNQTNKSVCSQDVKSIKGVNLQAEEKQTRTKRMNIPKTTLIDRKTGQVIENITPGRGELGYEHIEDREIVQRINRMLIDGEWICSSLLGKENRRSGEYSGEKSPRDLDFPAVLALVSPEMRENFKIHGGEHAHLIESPHKIKIVFDSMTFGLTPTNSRYFVFGIFCLTKNLEPALLALGFAKDQVVQVQKDDIYYTLMKTLIQANNPELAQQRRQLSARRRMLGRRIKQPEVISEKSFIFPELIFCRNDKLMAEACAKIRNEFSVVFEAHSSFLQRFEAMKFKFYRHELKKQRAILQRGEHVIKKMLQSNNPKDIELGIAQLKIHNQQFAFKYRKFELGKLCVQNFEKRFVGFNVYERFEQPMVRYLSTMVVQQNGHTLKQFLENVLKQEESQKKRQSAQYEDRCGLMTHNARLRVLTLIVQPNVLREILELFKIGRSLKCQKEVNSPVPRYLVGSGKRSHQVGVEFRHEMWKCDCGLQAKMGIPCSHLLRVLHTEKTTKYQDYINSRHYKIKLSGAVEIE